MDFKGHYYTIFELRCILGADNTMSDDDVRAAMRDIFRAAR